jgi:hypothetical protein
MILPESRTIKWLQQIATENNFPNITMLEKTIRAFSLLCLKQKSFNVRS